MPINIGAELARLTDLATPYAVRTAVTLRLPQRIADGTHTVSELAEQTHTDPDALGRLLRYLTAHGLFRESGPDTYTLTEVAEFLAGQSGGQLRAWLDLDGPGARMDAAFAGLPHAIRTGEPAYGAVHGQPFWPDLAAKPELRTFFDDVMSAHSYQTAPLVATEYDWSGIGSVMDLGGGNGALLAEILRVNPTLTGTVLDNPQTTTAATERFATAGLADRAGVLAGSFFDPLPAGADAYLLSRVLTDWNDPSVLRILRRCADALPAHGRVLIIEVLPDEDAQDHSSPYDLQMLVLVGGRRREPRDFAVLAEQAGLRLADTHRWAGGLVVLDLRPATQD